MKVRTPWNEGEIGTIPCHLGDVPVLRLLQYRCPHLKVGVTVGTRHTMVAIGDLNLHSELLTQLNKDDLPHVGEIALEDLGNLARFDR